MNVYKNGGEPSNTPTNSKYLGCFKDKYGDRALTYGSPRVSTNGMTYEVSGVDRQGGERVLWWGSFDALDFQRIASRIQLQRDTRRCSGSLFRT